MRSDNGLEAACARGTGPRPEPKETWEDYQAAVCPPPPLYYERAEIRRCCAVGQPLRMVVQTPAARGEVNSGSGVFDLSGVLDKDRNRMTAFFRDGSDLIE